MLLNLFFLVYALFGEYFFLLVFNHFVVVLVLAEGPFKSTSGHLIDKIAFIFKRFLLLD